MSTETANAARFKKGMMALSHLECELLQALEVLLEWPDCLQIPSEQQSGILMRSIAVIQSAHGETP